jgi:phytanoyl-CoA hydroxylase
MTEMPYCEIGNEEVQFFQDNGYLHVRDFVPQQKLKYLRAAVQDFIDDKRQASLRRDLGGTGKEAVGEETFVQILGMWKTDRFMKETACDRRRAALAAKLMQCESVRLLSDMILFKPGGCARPTYWHQDFPNHFNSIPEITIWVAVDDATKESGCMWYVPGSHKLGELIGYDFGDGRNVKEKGIDVSGAVAVEARPGDLVIHHGLTLHYAGPNTTTLPRRAYINRLVDARAAYRKNELVDGSTAEVSGQPLKDEDHPVIFR